MSLQLLKHELAHAAAGFAMGAHSVVIQVSECGEFWETHPYWPDDVSADALLISFLGGQLYRSGIAADDDDAFLSVLPGDEIERLWAIVLEKVKPLFDDLVADQVALQRMLAVLEGGQQVLIERETVN